MHRTRSSRPETPHGMGTAQGQSRAPGTPLRCRADGHLFVEPLRRCLVRLRPLRAGAGSLVFVALSLAHPGLGADVVEPTEQTWGDASEPGLHRLLRYLVHKAREHPSCAQRTRGDPHPRVRAPVDVRRVPQGPRWEVRPVHGAPRAPPRSVRNVTATDPGRSPGPHRGDGPHVTPSIGTARGVPADERAPTASRIRVGQSIDPCPTA